MEGCVTKTSFFPCFSEPSLTFSEKKVHLKVRIYTATGLGSGWYRDQGRDASALIHTLDIISGHWSQGQGRGLWQGGPLEAGESPPWIPCQLFTHALLFSLLFFSSGLCLVKLAPPPGTHLLAQS